MKILKKEVILAIIAVIIIGIVAIIVIQKNINTEENLEEIDEYTPEEEITDEQLRQTTVNLYFLNEETSLLESEGRLIDSSLLLNNPYLYIVQALLDGPQDESLITVFPEDTEILEASFSQGCVTLNFSEEILNYEDDNQKYNIVNCILNSLTQLTEVNSIKILVNGETVEDFSEDYSAIY